MRWWSDGRANANMQSASVELPPPPPVTALALLHDRVLVLLAFVQHFFDDTTRRLVSAASEMCVSLSVLGSWHPDDIPDLLRWMDGVFEDYRGAVQEFISTGNDRRDKIRERLSSSNPTFLVVLIGIHGNRAARLTRPSFNTASSRDQQPNQRNVQGARRSKVPPDVIAALPRVHGKSIFLRRLSTQGCSSRSPTRCVVDGRVHATPDALDPIVKRYIESELVGLRTDAARQP